MSESTTIVVSIIGAAVGIVSVLGMMLRNLATNVARQFEAVEKRSDSIAGRLDAVAEQCDSTARRLDELKTDMQNQFAETNRRLQRIETRIDDTNKRIDAVGRDVAALRDRTGALEGSLATFMSERRGANAA